MTYDEPFARIYSRHWGHLGHDVAKRIEPYYARTAVGRRIKSVLDVGCGTGQLGLHFLDRGYRFIGLDNSEAMLCHARNNTLPYVQAGRANFMKEDARHFSIDVCVGLVVATNDVLHHLDGVASVTQCLKCVYAALDEQGVVVFDLVTPLGLHTQCKEVHVSDGDRSLVVMRGSFDAAGKYATYEAFGYVRAADATCEHFSTSVRLIVLEPAEVRGNLFALGYQSVYFASIDSLSTPIDTPAEMGRVCVVAWKTRQGSV